MHEFFIKKNQNAPRPSEPSQGGKMSKRLGGIKGCKYKNIFMAFSYIITIIILGSHKRLGGIKGCKYKNIFMAFSYIITIIILGSHNFGLSSETRQYAAPAYLSPLLISLRSIQNCQR